MSEEKNNFDRVPIRIHPRVFAALGADLVTDDVVAVIELVKNSYDAFARNVNLSFRDDPVQGASLEIADDGNGMTRDDIEHAWCCVATPFKELNPVVQRNGKERRVSGEKGLGRLAAARLGKRLRMLTKAPGLPCWEVDVDWTGLAQGDDVSTSFARCREYLEKCPFEESGTSLSILGLNIRWDDGRLDNLKDNLARLISPFSARDEFNIYICGFEDPSSESVQIEAPKFLSNPKYSLQGRVDGTGNFIGNYRFTPIGDGKPRTKTLKHSWENTLSNVQNRSRFPYSDKAARCGPFDLELRAWDIAPIDTREIGERFEIQSGQVRGAIKAHKGIAVYRDGVLVLPKAESSRDWLGLDLRRVSRVGTRLSTNQIVGYVSITANENPGIKDTSDRERLVSSLSVSEFEEILKAAVGLLEIERDEDRTKENREEPLADLLEQVTAAETLDQVIESARKGEKAAQVIPVVRTLRRSLDSARRQIETRFVYYSRLATVGTIAHILVHEIRNRTTAIGSLLESVENRFLPSEDSNLSTEFQLARDSVDSLERLADTFAPLASRSFRRRRRHSLLEKRIKACLTLQENELERRHVRCVLPKSETQVAVDPGELDAILLNLITNAVYWMGEVPQQDRLLEFVVKRSRKVDRVSVRVRDQGPGIASEDLEKVFWPGVTRKPGGIGMGLTVASELVTAYGGRMAAENSNTQVGASFVFDLPIRRKSN